MLRTMNTLADLSLMLVRDVESFIREVELFDSDDALWRTLPGVSNSAGNLAIHVAGNLQHFIGAQLGATGYQRDREREFATRAGTRADVVQQLTAAKSAVVSTLSGLSDSALDRPMPGAPNNLVIPTGRFLLHLVAHTAFHLGQAGYLRRALSGAGAQSANPMPLGGLESR
jgi:uncharacterized damage-inducible protein DinB